MSGKLPKPSGARPPVRRSDSVIQFAAELGTDQFNKMKDVFMLYADSKGRASCSQLQLIMNALDINCSKGECSTFFTELDTESIGTVDFMQFIRGLKWIKTTALLSPQQQESKKLSRTKSIKQYVEGLDDSAIKKTKELFAMCDSDGDGVITKTELYNLVKELGLEMTKTEVSVLFSTLDANNDGKLQFQEFLEGMRWLNKGMRVAASSASPSSSSIPQENADISETALKDALDRNKVLLSFIKDLVGKTLETAKSEISNNKLRSADILLQIVDVNKLTEMEVLIGTIVDPKDVTLYHKMKSILADKAKEASKK